MYIEQSVKAGAGSTQLRLSFLCLLSIRFIDAFDVVDFLLK